MRGPIAELVDGAALAFQRGTDPEQMQALGARLCEVTAVLANGLTQSSPAAQIAALADAREIAAAAVELENPDSPTRGEGLEQPKDFGELAVRLLVVENRLDEVCAVLAALGEEPPDPPVV